MPTHLLLRGLSFDLLQGLDFSPDEALSRLTAARATSVEVGASQMTDAMAEKLSQTRLGVFLQADADALDYPAPVVDLAKALKARALNIHLSDHAGADAGAVQAYLEKTGDAVPLIQLTAGWSPAAAAQLIDAVPNLRLILDVEALLDSDSEALDAPAALAALDPVLDRVELIYGRWDERAKAAGELYHEVWAEAMRRWRRRNPAGSTLTFFPAPVLDGSESLEERLARCDEIWQKAQAAWKASWR